MNEPFVDAVRYPMGEGLAITDCPKCLYPSSDHRLRYCSPEQPVTHEAKVADEWVTESCATEYEHFHHTCDRCGYRWQTEMA